jgi:DivIVA domain-containing protein
MADSGVHRVSFPRTPEQIAAQRFGRVRRGYDPLEVERFLREVAEDYRRAMGLSQWAIENGAAQGRADETPVTRAALEMLNERLDAITAAVERLAERGCTATRLPVPTDAWWPREAPLDLVTQRRTATTPG